LPKKKLKSSRRRIDLRIVSAPREAGLSLVGSRTMPSHAWERYSGNVGASGVKFCTPRPFLKDGVRKTYLAIWWGRELVLPGKKGFAKSEQK